MTTKNKNKVFIYWDNSNIFHEVQRLAVERNSGADARERVRIDFENMLHLAHADREIGRAVAAGSVPPEIRQLWNRLESRGVEVELFDRGEIYRGEQEIPDRFLQLKMYEDGYDYKDTPGTIVLLTGDGAGYWQDTGFHRTLERLHKGNWRIEILSWRHACNQRMRKWAVTNGVFVALDDFYESITFMESSHPGHELAASRKVAPLDLSKRAQA